MDSADQIRADLIDREEIEVMFLRTADEPSAIRAGWEELEARIGSLRGRKFLGTFDVATSEYRACVKRREGDDAGALELETGTVAGGSYMRTRLRGEPPAVYDRISPTFERLVRAAEPDPTRPSIESYRRRDEIDLLVPVNP